jgi:hypothetical protein
MARPILSAIVALLVISAFVIAGVIWYLQSQPTQRVLPRSEVSVTSSATTSEGTPTSSKSSRRFYNSPTCYGQVITDSLDPSIEAAATATVVAYCSQSPSGTVYGTINDANYFSNGEIINGDLYITKTSQPTTTIVYGQPTLGWPQNEVWFYKGSTAEKLIYALPADDTSSIGSISVSPDESTLALMADDKSLDIIGANGALLKTITDLPPGTAPAGWGNSALWLEEGSEDAPGYMKISLADWSMNTYYPDVGVPNNDEALNYDTGDFAATNFPWIGDPESYSQFIENATGTVSLFVENLLTGATETVATENISALGGDFEPEWIDDDTLQYNISSTTQATTSIQ